MDTKQDFFWTLDDYKRFLQHPDYAARQWALERIEAQYPRQAAACVVDLLKDPEILTSGKAAALIGASGDPQYEPALLDALPQSTGSARRDILNALGKLRSAALLPQIIAELDAVDLQEMRGARHYEVIGLITALGHYSAKDARAALWRFIERYPFDDEIAYNAFSSLLKFPDVHTIPRLVARYVQLAAPSHMPWQTAYVALAAEVGLARPADEVRAAIQRGPEEMLRTLESWLGTALIISGQFINVFFSAARQNYYGLLPYIVAEISDLAETRGDDLAGWEGIWVMGGRPKGFRWRTLYAYALVSALADNPPTEPRRYEQALGLCLTLMGQVGIDRDDETLLRAATDADEQREVLLEILGSPRFNVMTDVVERVAALGPDVVPDLIYLLDDYNFWAALRAVEALTEIARVHPGAADDAVPAILDLMYGEQSDYMLEMAMTALQVIGPASIAPAAARLGQVDFSYDIYVTGALCEIPTTAALDALLKFMAEKDVDDGDFHTLETIGHRRGFELLKDDYVPGVRGLDDALYTLGVLNDYDGAEMAQWRAVAQEGREQLDKLLTTDPAQLFHELMAKYKPAAEDQPRQKKRRGQKQK